MPPAAPLPDPAMTPDKADPGDETARNFRYQYAYGVILLAASASGKRSYVSIWCEQHEDYLAELPDGRYDAYQIKTRRPANGAWRMNHGELVKSVRRFVSLVKKFGDRIRQLYFVSNTEYDRVADDHKDQKRRGRQPLAFLTHVKACSDPTLVADPFLGVFNTLVGECDCEPTELFETLKRMELIIGPSRDSFHTVVAHEHLPAVPGCQDLSVQELADWRDWLIARVCERSSLAVNDPLRHLEPLFDGTGLSPAMAAKRLRPAELMVRRTSLPEPADVARAVAEATVKITAARSKRVNAIQLVGEHTLSRPENVPKHERRPSERSGSQLEAFEALLQAVTAWDENPDHRWHVLTGEAGVGKTIVIRRVCQVLAQEFLSEPAPSVLPIGVPLVALNWEADELAALDKAPKDAPPSWSETAWRAIATAWCRWASGLLKSDKVNVEWLERYMAEMPVALFLDGIDDLVVRHPVIRVRYLREIALYLLQRFPHLRIVLGVRSTQPGVSRSLLRSHRDFAIRRLTLDDAEAYLPGVRKLFESLSIGEDQALVGTILTPLIFFSLLPTLQAEVDRRSSPTGRRNATLSGRTDTPHWLQSKARMMEHALRLIIQSGPLCGSALGNRPPEDWLDALTFAAWTYYCLAATRELVVARIGVSDLAEACAADLARWEQFIAEQRRDDESGELRGGFALACKRDTLGPLLAMTVFYPAENDQVEFVHREWQEFLVARHFTQCVAFLFAEEWGRMAYNLNITRLAAEILGTFVVSKPAAETICARWHATKNHFIVGNFFSVVAISPTARFTRKAVDVFLASLPTMEPFTRSLLIFGFGNRALINPKLDGARKLLIRVLPRYARVESTIDPVSASAAWCYLACLVGLEVGDDLAFSLEVDQGPPERLMWPGLPERPQDERQTLVIFCDPGQDTPTIHPRQRSLQMAVAALLESIHLNDHRANSVVHYLYYLTTLARHEALTEEAFDSVEHAFTETSQLRLVLKNYSGRSAPVLNHIFSLCNRQWLEAAEAWSAPDTM